MSEAADGWLEELRSAVGAEASDDEVDVEGLGLVSSVTPADAEAFARGLALLSSGGRAAVIRGSGTQRGLGNPLRRADVALSTEKLSGIDTFDPQDGVLHAGAGTKLSEIRSRVNAEGWELSLDPAGEGEGGTLGGALSTAAIGPRRLGFGAPRDAVLGLDVMLATGERTRCGGRVVKNVTGYDLAKLYTGSFGTLGVIEGAWLRLRPLPEDVAQCSCDVASLEKGIEFGIALSRRYSARAALLLSPGLARQLEEKAEDDVSAWRIVAEFAGDEAATGRDVAWFEEQTRGTSSGAGVNRKVDAIARVGAMQGRGLGPKAMRARVALMPSQLVRFCEALRRGGAELIVHPGQGLAYAIFDGRELNPAIELLQSTTLASEGSLLFESLAEFAKSGHDVFAASRSELSIMHELKQRFDPAGVLNPGRFAGGI
jgi:glycolate oxidase FAD binding subunit